MYWNELHLAIPTCLDFQTQICGICIYTTESQVNLQQNYMDLWDWLGAPTTSWPGHHDTVQMWYLSYEEFGVTLFLSVVFLLTKVFMVK